MPDRDYTIRPARAADAEALEAMWLAMSRQHAGYDPERWNWAEDIGEKWRAHFLEIVDKPETVCLVAAVGDSRLIGYVMAAITEPAPVWATRRRGQVYDLFVADEHRRRGVGKKLMQAAFDELKARGAEDVILRVSKDNLPAVKHYESVGMRIVVYEMYKRL